jgi:hypothetical protein
MNRSKRERRRKKKRKKKSVVEQQTNTRSIALITHYPIHIFQLHNFIHQEIHPFLCVVWYFFFLIINYFDTVPLVYPLNGFFSTFLFYITLFEQHTFAYMHGHNDTNYNAHAPTNFLPNLNIHSLFHIYSTFFTSSPPPPLNIARSPQLQSLIAPPPPLSATPLPQCVLVVRRPYRPLWYFLHSLLCSHPISTMHIRSLFWRHQVLVH